MITPDEIGKQISDKLEHLRVIRWKSREAKKELRKTSIIARKQERERKYWTKEQRREHALREIIEAMRVLESELTQHVNMLYEDLSKKN